MPSQTQRQGTVVNPQHGGGAAEGPERQFNEQEKKKQLEERMKQRMNLKRGIREYRNMVSYYTRTRLFPELKYKAPKSNKITRVLKRSILEQVGLTEQDVEKNGIWQELDGVFTDTLLSRRNSVQHGVKQKVKSECFGCFVRIMLELTLTLFFCQFTCLLHS